MAPRKKKVNNWKPLVWWVAICIVISSLPALAVYYFLYLPVTNEDKILQDLENQLRQERITLELDYQERIDELDKKILLLEIELERLKSAQRR